MPKLLKNKGHLLTISEYNRIIKYDNEHYIIPVLVCDLTEEEKQHINNDIKDNMNRSQITIKYNIEPELFDLYLDNTWNTKKITRVREILRKNSEIAEKLPN